MDFKFGPIYKIASLDKEGFHIFDSKDSSKYQKNQGKTTNQNSILYQRYQNISVQNGRNNQSNDNQFVTIIDTMGELSAKAQGLNQTITTFEKVRQNPDHKLYFKAENSKVLGFIKTGKKHLFYRDRSGNIKELDCLCVLDFYCHESVQRQGIGKQLFEFMLKQEKIEPQKLAYDRPSHKFLSFLKKYYALECYTSQNSNFVIFDKYFTTQQSNQPMLSENEKNQIKKSYNDDYGAYSILPGSQKQYENRFGTGRLMQSQTQKQNYHMNSFKGSSTPLGHSNINQEENQGFSKIGRNILNENKVNFQADEEQKKAKQQPSHFPNSIEEIDLFEAKLEKNEKNGESSQPHLVGLQGIRRKSNQARSLSKKKVTFKDEAEILDEKIKEQLFQPAVVRAETPQQTPKKIDNLQQTGYFSTGKPPVSSFHYNQQQQQQQQQHPPPHQQQPPRLQNYHNLAGQNKKPPLLPSIQNPNQGPLIVSHDQNNKGLYGRNQSQQGLKVNQNDNTFKRRSLNNTYDQKATNGELMVSSTPVNKNLPPSQLSPRNDKFSIRQNTKINNKKMEIQENIKKTEKELDKAHEKLSEITRGRQMSSQDRINDKEHLQNNNETLNKNIMLGGFGSGSNNFNNSLGRQGNQVSAPWAQNYYNVSKQQPFLPSSSGAYGSSFKKI